MPAMTIMIKAKTKEELKKQTTNKIKDAAKRGLQYVRQGYSDSRVRKVKGGYEIEILVHS
jgi:hypothetical protein